MQTRVGHRWLLVAAGAVALVGCGASDPRSLRANAIVGEQAASSSVTRKSVGMVAAAVPGAMAAVVAPMTSSSTSAIATPPTLLGGFEDHRASACTSGMVSIEGRYCIDRYEASLVETDANGEEHPFSPYSAVSRQHVRAVSTPNVYPQGYISATQASEACAASGKRLCKAAEWQLACRGPEKKQWGYGDAREVGRCNDNGKNPVVSLFGPRYDAKTMNRSQLNQLDGTLARTGEHAGCSNGYGVYDMVGNLHEWISDANGTFNGGYYQDVVKNGQGCGYQTKAHEARYHDYSTGFRCCADGAGESADTTAPAMVAATGPRTKPPAAKKKSVKSVTNWAPNATVAYVLRHAALRSENDRNAVRRAIQLSCQIVRERDFRLVAEKALDLSPDGMFVTTDVDLEPGENVFVSFRATELGIWFDSEAKVTRVVRGRRPSDTGRGVALRFSTLSNVKRFILKGHLRRIPPHVPRRAQRIDWAKTAQAASSSLRGRP